MGTATSLSRQPARADQSSPRELPGTSLVRGPVDRLRMITQAPIRVLVNQELFSQKGTVMSVKSKGLVAATALAVVGGVSTAGALSASAATPGCSQHGNTCI